MLAAMPATCPGMARPLQRYTQDKDNHSVLGISDPIGSPLRPYAPNPFASSAEAITSSPWLSLSPDGKQILLLLPVGGKPDEAWLLPYPSGSGSPHQISIFRKLPFYATYPTSSWMPDNRNAVISIQSDQKSALHLWLADTRSNDLSPLTTGTNDERYPSVSPDGRSILYTLFMGRSRCDLGLRRGWYDENPYLHRT